MYQVLQVYTSFSFDNFLLRSIKVGHITEWICSNHSGIVVDIASDKYKM